MEPVAADCYAGPLAVSGLAEGLTGGVDNYTGLPARFLWLGQGFLGGVIPAQAPWLVVMALAYWLLLHRSVKDSPTSRSGNNAAASRHAGIPVQGVSSAYIA